MEQGRATGQGGAEHSTVEPRERLPPCVRGLVVFENQQACWHDMSRCLLPDGGARHVVTVGKRGPKILYGDCTDGAIRTVYGMGTEPFITDDEDAAEQAWEQAVARLERED